VLPWLVRASWLAVPFTCGTVIAGALDDRSAAVQTVAAVLLWAGWGAAVVALLVPRPAGVVVARLAATGLAGVTAWSIDGSGDALLALHALVALALALSPHTGEWLVNGAAYGYERRYLLRLPAPLYAPVVLAGLLVPVAIGAGPLLLAAEQWVAGALATAAGAAIAYLLVRALLSLTQRWAVLVPAGLVLKDHFALLDPVLFRRLQIGSMGMALAGTDALDLTAAAPGGAVEVQLDEKEPITKVSFGRRDQEMLKVGRFLFTPSRPDALLADAAGRRFRAQTATPPPSTTSPS